MTTSSRIVSMLSFSSFGFVAVFGASDDNQLYKVSDLVYQQSSMYVYAMIKFYKMHHPISYNYTILLF